MRWFRGEGFGGVLVRRIVVPLCFPPRLNGRQRAQVRLRLFPVLLVLSRWRNDRKSCRSLNGLDMLHPEPCQAEKMFTSTSLARRENRKSKTVTRKVRKCLMQVETWELRARRTFFSHANEVVTLQKTLLMTCFRRCTLG